MAPQPFYAAFLRETGGGSNADFILWIGGKWREFEAARPSHLPRVMRLDEFGAWLDATTQQKDAA